MNHPIALFALFVLGFATGIGPATAQDSLSPDRRFVQQRLADERFSAAFTEQLLSSYDEKTFAQVLRLNILGILARPRHQTLVTPEAVSASRAFIAANSAILKRAEREYGVSRSVLAALLWVETRHGGYTGKFHVPSAFLHLSQAGRPDVIRGLFDLAESTMDRTQFPPNWQRLVEDRAQLRATWSIEQLKALETLADQGQLKVRSLIGSFAGAFGIPQFIPTSFQRWAVSSRRARTPNLFLMPDAILSAAHYLYRHGWRANDSATHIPALLGYNNSVDYANSIMDLAKKVER